MSTYRERRLAKAERLRGWAETRQARDSEPTAAEQALSQIPFGQPILVGHHSERAHRNALARADQATGRRLGSLRKAEEMEARADNIKAAAARAIYDDDSDATERLREKLAELEAKRERIKAYNANCRKAAKAGGIGDLGLLDETQRAEIASIARSCPYQLRGGGAAPAYWSANLSGNIKRTRDRLEHLQRHEAEPRGAGKWIDARYPGECARCRCATPQGERVAYFRKTREVLCLECAHAEARGE